MMARAHEGHDDWRGMHLVVSGRVQGVGFRHHVTRSAQEVGVVGWVRNLEDGDVEVYAEGPAEALEALAEAVRRGPRHALVDRMTRRDVEGTRSSVRFEVRF